MTPKHLFILLLALTAAAVAQNEDELHIPVENDNQFPPDNHPEPDVVLEEGSGAGVIEEPLETTTKTSESPAPILEDVQLTSALINSEPMTTTSEHSCPTSCVCNIEGDSNNYVVDCSNAGLKEFPKPLDAKTTQLNLENNELTEIPKDISALSNLKMLNANNNKIMDIVAGSISELPELTSLKLGNNRLIEYPTDLKNSFGLTKLEELDLGRNDMRTALQTETFSNFKALKKLILPESAADLAEHVCAALKESLDTVCIGSCDAKTFECPEAPQGLEDDLLDFALPGLIALGTAPEDENEDPSVSTAPETKPEAETPETLPTPTAVEPTATSNDTSALFRATVIQAPDEAAKPTETEAKPTEESVASKTQGEAKTEGEVVGATTVDTKTGGVDKSVIGMIVAGMVVVVAGITIKKNWSSIKKRFSSSPRAANDRSGASANGTTPEEVPLQDKSPV